ncbi:hypothetical protein AMS68_004289 [Peltaster fructicola]|uniref:Uncharacterized protein n=1 Tax=Peltaster fructicola TaxID=286661 RepID=A0A6H0XVI0_9PEZI|nr:hypothetical protein AMS68_004289 [Peltaster fructicola]
MPKRAAQHAASTSPAKKQKNGSGTATPTSTSDNSSDATTYQDSVDALQPLTSGGRPRRIRTPSKRSQVTTEAEMSSGKKTRASPQKSGATNGSKNGLPLKKGKWTFEEYCILVSRSSKRIKHAETGAELRRTPQACRIQLHHLKHGLIKTSYLECRDAISTKEFAERLRETNTSALLQRITLSATAQKRTEYMKATIAKEDGSSPTITKSPSLSDTSATSVSTWLSELSESAHLKSPTEALKAKTVAAHKRSTVRSLKHAASSLVPPLAKLRELSPVSDPETKQNVERASEHGWRSFQPINHAKPPRSTAELSKAYSARELEAAEALQLLRTAGHPVTAADDVVAATALLKMVGTPPTIERKAETNNKATIKDSQGRRSNLHGFLN